MLYIFVIFVIISNVFSEELQTQSFRIIAPQIICPKDKDVTEKPDTTAVMVQARGGRHLNLDWKVRWIPIKKPTQRFTLLLWRSVRNLEEFLNREQPEPFLYIIDNRVLLPDVEYVFNVTGMMNEEVVGQKSFRINNVSGKSKLELNDGQADKFSLVLLGGDLTYPNVEYVLEAQVTMCRPTQDYHFSWSIEDYENNLEVSTGDIGSRLSLQPGSLIAGHSYEITCEVLRSSDNLFINQMKYSVEVMQRGLEAALSADYLVVSTGHTFDIYAVVFNHDYLAEEFHYEWWCTFEGEQCESFESVDSDHLELWSGLLEVGKYEIGVTIKAEDDSANVKIVVETVEPRLPVLEINPISRIVHEGSRVLLVGNASNIAPSCSLAWYFTPLENITTDNTTCEDCELHYLFINNIDIFFTLFTFYDLDMENLFHAFTKTYWLYVMVTWGTNTVNINLQYEHGELLTDIITILSIEENFLNELADFNNDTEWRQITAEIGASSGRARFLAKCGCSLTFSCDTAGVVYADVFLDLNHSPLVGDVTVTPTSGTALETLFTIRTRGVQDYDPPLKYSFYTEIDDNINLLLDTYLEYVAVETYLPFVDGNTKVWVVVCDSLGACGYSSVLIVNVAIGNIMKVETLIETAEAYLRRCELIELTRISGLAVTTFKNSGDEDELTAFTSRLTEMLAEGPSISCRNDHGQHYSTFLEFITSIGIDTTNLD